MRVCEHTQRAPSQADRPPPIFVKAISSLPRLTRAAAHLDGPHAPHRAPGTPHSHAHNRAPINRLRRQGPILQHRCPRCW